MNLNYDKLKAKHEHGGNHWTSYSDLFLVLSVVFLLLYVVANIRTGGVSLATKAQIDAAKQELAQLREQIKVYDAARDSYVTGEASAEEKKIYQEVMSKIDLLEDEATEKRAEAEKQLRVAQEKEDQLNKYQALVKNIVSANLLAQSKIKQRDEVITQKQRELTYREELAARLQTDIDRNNRKISDIQERLAKKQHELKWADRMSRKSKEKFTAEVARLKEESEKSIVALRTENENFSQELSQTKEALEETTDTNKRLATELSEREKKFVNTIADLKRDHEETLAREKADFDKKLGSAALTAEQRVAKEREYAEGLAKKNSEYESKLVGLNSELNSTRQGISKLEAKYQGTVKNLEGRLAASSAKLNERRALAGKIKGALAKAGIGADIDGATGDVVIQFGKEYFDKNSSRLKSGMVDKLEKFFPVYSRALFEDKAVGEKIVSVEIVGFASPTYQGRYVDPNSLSAADRKAVDFNMDLSYQRAKSIFSHAFDPTKMKFSDQKRMLPLVKVSGRSYLATDRLQTRGLASAENLADGEYCAKFDCNKSQKVIIKFNLKEQ